jgi:O-antigen/teichoic acid export membrane protein
MPAMKLLQKIWASPTLMTWGSFATNSLSLVVVLPLILIKLNTEEIVVWYLFSTIIGLQILVDLGFSPTFLRVIAYSMGGASSTDLKDFREVSQKKDFQNCQPDWNTVNKICSTMRVIYDRLTIVLISLLGIFGTLALLKPISLMPNYQWGWVSWTVIVLASAVTLKGNIYNSYLQGVNEIALLRRWDIITSLASIITSFLVLGMGGGLLGLVLSNQGWIILKIWRNRCLARTAYEAKFQTFTEKKLNPEIFSAVWPSAWRSGLGVFMTYGLIQLSSVLYAQIGSTGQVASYLLSLRLIQAVSQFSNAPFYSKLPLLAKLRAEGKINQQILLAKRAMTLAYWTYLIGFLILGILSKPLLQLIGSNANFAEPRLWSLMGLSLFAERYGAMHIQLYSTTNHIIWHTANGVSGIIYAMVSLSLLPKIGVYAFPVGLLAGYLGFYCWYSARYSYKTFGLKFWSFEKSVMLPPLFILLCYTVYSLYKVVKTN